MAAAQEEIFLGQVGRAHMIVAGCDSTSWASFSSCSTMTVPLGSQSGRPGPNLFVEDEDLQLTAQFAMIALLGLFQHVEMLLEFLLVAPGRAVDALQHRVVLIAAPVGAGDSHELEAVRRDLARVFHMRATTEIFKRILRVGADERLLNHLIAVFIDVAGFKSRRSDSSL